MTNWETCVQFHGHACGGLTIGYKAACYAAELLELSFSGDEQVVCIAENDACGVDAIQALLGCSIGKGNLLFHMRGKQAFSFYNRATGKSVRLVLRPRPEGMTREESFAYYQAQKPADLFDVKPATIPLPEPAKLFDSYPCACCGEVTGCQLDPPRRRAEAVPRLRRKLATGSTSENNKKPASRTEAGVQFIKNLVEFRRRSGERRSDHFLRRHVRRRQYRSGCKCGICAPAALKLCAQQTAASLSKSNTF